MAWVSIKRKNGIFRYWDEPTVYKSSKLDIDFKTVSRYIASSYLPGQFKICAKILANYERVHPLDIYGIAHLRLELEDRMEGVCK